MYAGFDQEPILYSHWTLPSPGVGMRRVKLSSIVNALQKQDDMKEVPALSFSKVKVISK